MCFHARTSLAFLLLTAAASLAGAQETRVLFTIYGQVLEPDGKPAARAAIAISGQAGFAARALADDMGRFEIPDITRGRYRLTASNPSAPDQYSDPVDVDVGRASSFRVSANIFLRRGAVRTAVEERPGVVSLTEAIQSVPKPARKAFEQGLKRRGERRYEDSLRSFTRALDLFPSFFQAFAERGHLLIAMGRAPEAAQDFARALELDALYGPALRGAGICKFQQGKYAEAIQDLERAADVEPGNATNYLFMGTALVALDRREEARAALLKALGIDPNGAARAHVHLANIFIKENKPREALAEIETYLSAVPDAPDRQRLVAIQSQLRSAVER